MTAERAAFICELSERATHSNDGALMKRAAVLLIGDEGPLYDAFVAEAAARREADRPDLTDRHRAVAQKALDAATAYRQSVETPQEQIDGHGDDGAGEAGEGSAEEAGTKTESIDDDTA